jgi:hypothetical protein
MMAIYKVTNRFYQTIFISILLSTSLMAQNDNLPWVSLFNGRNLDGWKTVGSKGNVTIRDGAITCNMVANTPEHTFFCSNEKYGDFILELDVKTDSIYNTGILIRCIDAPKNVDTCKVSLYGYQVKIDPTPRKWTGGIFDDYGKTWHWFYSLLNDSRAKEAYSIGKWNHFRIEAIGSGIRVWVNGIPTTNMTNQKYAKGYIAIKIHALGDKPEQEKIFGQFKNIRIIKNNPEKYLKQMDLKAIEVQ